MSRVLPFEASFATWRKGRPLLVAARRACQSPGVKLLAGLALAAIIAAIVHLEYRAITPRLSPMARACEERLKIRLRSTAAYERISVKDNGEKNVKGERLIFIRYEARHDFGAAIRETEVCRYDPQGNLVGEHATKLAIERVIDSLTRP